MIHLTDASARQQAIQAVTDAPDGHVVEIRPPHRSLPQNSLIYKWYAEIAAQTYDDAHEVRQFCKLRFGVPILRAENAKFCETYDRVIKPRTYQEKIAAMDLIDVTSIMNKKQAAQYMDDLFRYFTQEGIQLSHPEDQGREDMLR